MPIIQRNYSKNRRKGNIGEDIACLFLMKQGFRIVDRNYLKPWGEIDIIAFKLNTFHFFEVKSVSCEMINDSVSHETVTRETSYIRPEENMTKDKSERLRKVIKTFLIDKKVSHETPFYADLITVRFDQLSKMATVEHFHDVL